MKNIFWIRGNPPASLAIVLCPPGGHGLRDELLVLKNAGIDTLVSLLEEQETHLFGLSKESQLAEQVGLRFLSFPIRDAHLPPDRAAFRAFAQGLANRLREGEAVGIHCLGSIGRSAVMAACALIHLGWTPHAALAAITTARGVTVPETQEQEDWIMRYKALP
jgi:protein-tyrosine phosphatase